MDYSYRFLPARPFVSIRSVVVYDQGESPARAERVKKGTLSLRHACGKTSSLTSRERAEIDCKDTRTAGADMMRHIGIIASLFVLMLIHMGIGSAETYLSQQDPKGHIIAQEEALIVTTLNEVANAESQFSKTKDAASILRFYAQDYAGIKDGKLETVKDHKTYLAGVLEQINSDEPIDISSKVTNIKPSVAGSFGWATYEYEYKIWRSGGRSGVLQQVSQGQCTAIFTKQADSWLVRHEHCSTTNPTPFFLNQK